MAGIAEALQIALQHHNAGNVAEAERIYREILKFDPNHADSLHLLGVIAFHAGRPDAARALIQRAIIVNPVAPEYHSNFGNVLKESGSLEEAIVSYRRAISLRPDFADAHFNLGNAYLKDELYEEAVECYRESLRIRPDYPPGWVNMGNALRALGRIPEALTFYERVPQHAADYAEARWNRAIALLLSGDFAAGWDEYECRWNLERARPRLRKFTQPVWDGADINGRTILLHAEQGFGDTIQFVRYAPMVAERGARVVVECQPQLVKLVEGMNGVTSVVAAGAKLPAFDLHLPLLSAPRIFRTDLNTIPLKVPYLKPDPARAREWTAKLPRGRKKLRVGLVWAGGTSDPKRDCSLTTLAAPLASLDVVFVSLQKGDASAQAALLPKSTALLDLSGVLEDFSDTAALIGKLDLVISVDTAAAHLAGALGAPVWTLLRFAPDWRWLLDREDSPWYPTMRLYRQHAPGDWSQAIARLTKDFAALLRKRRA